MYTAYRRCVPYNSTLPSWKTIFRDHLCICVLCISSLYEDCNGDFYTTSCKVQCSSSCAKFPGKTTCSLQDGYCLNGCGKGTWGPLCNKLCSKGCLDMKVYQVCERNNGTCKHGCLDGYDGDMCEKTMKTKQTGGKYSQRWVQRK